MQKTGFHPWGWVEKMLWRRKWQPTPVFWLGESHEQRKLAGYSPWSRGQTRLRTHTVSMVCGIYCICTVYPWTITKLKKKKKLSKYTLQCCISGTAKQVSYTDTDTDTYSSSFFIFPSNLGHHRALTSIPSALKQVLISYLFYT